MDHYLDIRLRPDPEFPPAQLMSVLFGKLHQALVAQGGDRIGVSFPTSTKAAPGWASACAFMPRRTTFVPCSPGPGWKGCGTICNSENRQSCLTPHRTVRSVGFRRKAIRNVCGGGSCAGTI